METRQDKTRSREDRRGKERRGEKNHRRPALAQQEDRSRGAGSRRTGAGREAAILNAQRMCDNMVADAQSRADLLIRDAEIRAKKIVDGAEATIATKKTEFENLKAEVSRFRD